MTILSHADIIQNVPRAYESALESGDLFCFPSTVVKHNELGVDFEIRLCPALQHKPALPTPHFDSVATNVGTDANKKFDPFAPPYNPQLYLGDIGDDETDNVFVILLNKYSVVPHHFLMVTKEFSSQASPLLPIELVQTYKLLIAARKAGQHLFAFYNCGDNSGASQPHKHIQFLSSDTSAGPPIEGLARRAQLEVQGKPFALTSLPYASHSYRLPPYFETYPAEDLENILRNAFIALLDLTFSTIRHDPDYPAGRPSFNVIMTLEHIHIVPRKQETHKLSKSGDGLSVNSLGFAGCLLVKSESELEAVKEETVGEILRGVGVNSVHDLQVAGTCDPVPAVL
ncbi:ATP adenylyltransferase [Coprinopsis marcescibilis]|uniref:ATP adenylyltransferase n=1 Tax=Coprinopsis marcescibilis TaxID=230819 RepID=A0A5C3KUT4_COPMA|nr:ATP adenylyltransferase [Coprinopsis marcescibilis]